MFTISTQCSDLRHTETKKIPTKVLNGIFGKIKIELQSDV